MRCLRLLALPALLSAMCLLSGCFDLRQEVWINGDGSGRLVVDTGLSAGLATMSDPDKDDGKTFLEVTRERCARLKEDLKADQAVTTFTVTEYDRDDLHHFVYDVSLKDATRIGEAYRRIMAGKNDTYQEETNRLSVSRDAGGNLVFSQVLASNRKAEESTEESTEEPTKEPTKEQAREEAAATGQPGSPAPAKADSPAEAAPGDDERLSKIMAASFFRGLYLTTRLHAPAIGTTNGTLDKDGRNAEWRVPLSELASTGSFRKEFRALIPVRGPKQVAPEPPRRSARGRRTC